MRQSNKHGKPAVNNSQKKESSGIEWHPAFIEAIQLELEDYKDILEFHTEHHLTTAPLQIDCVIIKKTDNTPIKKNIAAIFRKINLLEYKSPEDYIAVSDFYKVCSYAYLYASLEKVPITAITISFIGNTYPRKLFQHLKNILEYKVAESSPGIYTVKGNTGVIKPGVIQIIDSRKLSETDNLWLRNLSNRLNSTEAKRIINEVKLRGKSVNTEAYLHAISWANIQTIEEIIKMSKKAKTLEQVFRDVGWLDKWEAEGKAEGEVIGEAKGRQEQTFDIAKNMINLGLPIETIVSATKLDPDKVKELSLEQAV